MYIIFDIGGTKMRLAGSRDAQTYGDPRIEPTPAEFDAAMALFARMAEEVASGEPIEALCGGIPSPLDHDRNVLLSPTNLPLWQGKALRDELARSFNRPVFIENDAALVSLGEAHDGAGAGFPIVGYITVSTGVGGAKIVDGRLDPHAAGFEPGRMIVDADGTLCPDCEPAGGPKSLESLVSGRAFERRFGKKPAEVPDENVWDELARYLAIGLVNVIVEWSPDAVVLGGSMIVRPVGIKVEQVKEHLKIFGAHIPSMPEIRQATLADEGGLHGALAYLRQNLS